MKEKRALTCRRCDGWGTKKEAILPSYVNPYDFKQIANYLCNSSIKVQYKEVKCPECNGKGFQLYLLERIEDEG